MSNNFRTIGYALRHHIADTYNLLAAIDSVVAALPDLDLVQQQEEEETKPTITTPDGSATWDWEDNCWRFDHGMLVSKVIDSDEAMNFLYERKKIYAIKWVRRTTLCGLKAAKEAVEDQRVIDAVAESAEGDPWTLPSEPPF